jgi:hypothetical protein
MEKLWLDWSGYVPMLAVYWLFSIPIWVESLKRVSKILEVNELVVSICISKQYLSLPICPIITVCKFASIHKGCSLEYSTQEPPTPTHYAKGNMSLVITHGTARMQPITHGHTLDDCCMKLRDLDISSFVSCSALLALPTKARILCLDSLWSLRDFDPWVTGLFLYEVFLKDDILACVET